MSIPLGLGSSDTLSVSPDDLKSAAQMLRTINTDASTLYQTAYSRLLGSISFLPGHLHDWAADNLHSWNQYIQDQVFNGNEQVAKTLDSAADGFSLEEQYITNMFTLQ